MYYEISSNTPGDDSSVIMPADTEKDQIDAMLYAVEYFCDALNELTPGNTFTLTILCHAGEFPVEEFINEIEP